MSLAMPKATLLLLYNMRYFEQNHLATDRHFLADVCWLVQVRSSQRDVFHIGLDASPSGVEKG